MKLQRSFVEEIIAHARQDVPNECCGIIAGNDGSAEQLYRAVNAEGSPYRYNVDPKDLLRIYRDIDEHGWDVLAIYHSHVRTEAYPSPTDVRLAAWPEAYYLIVSLASEKKPVLRAFNIKDGKVNEADLEIT